MVSVDQEDPVKGSIQFHCCGIVMQHDVIDPNAMTVLAYSKRVPHQQMQALSPLFAKSNMYIK